MTTHELPHGRDGHERGLELAAAAVDFELSPVEAAELEAIIAGCPTCARRAAAMRADALVLGRPLTLVPSARVDAAIAAEIAHRTARSGRLTLVAAAALLALALLGAAAVGAYLLRTWQTVPPITVVPSPTAPVAIASPDPSAPPAVPGETWQAIAFASGDEGWMEAVTFDGGDLVGVGRGGCVPDFNSPTDCFGAAWMSAGGAPWVRAADQPGLAIGLVAPTSGPDKGIFDVAAGPAGFVAIGRKYADGFLPGIWRSADGQRWETVALGPYAAGAFFDAIAANPQGYVIVGKVVDYGALTARAAAWISADALTWTRVADTASMDVGRCQDTGEEPDCAGMRSVAWTGSQFVAVGQSRSDGGSVSRPAAWTSPDGQAWTRVDGGLDFDGHLSSVTANGSLLIAVGTICQPTCIDLANGVAATSPDGTTWTVTPIAGSTELGDVAFAGGYAFAVGAPTVAPPPASLQIWRSADGIAWQRQAGPPPVPDATSFSAVDIAATGSRIAISGWAEARNDEGRARFAFMSPSGATTQLPPTEAAAPTPAASAPATPSPSNGPVATRVDPDVLLRVDVRPDVSVGRMPSMTVYRDGVVLRREDPSGSITRLTAEGLEELLAAAKNDKLFAASGSIGPDPAYQGGYTSYSIALRRGAEMVIRSTTNAPAPASRAEAESIIALADRLTDLDTWLAPDAWATGPAEAGPYVASDYLLKVTVFKRLGVDYPPQALDRADVKWPLPGSLEGFGDLVEDPPLGNGTTSRCGLLTLAKAVAVQGALAAAPFNPVAENLQAELDWAPSIGHVTVTLIPLLPDDRRDCTVDGSWP